MLTDLLAIVNVSHKGMLPEMAWSSGLRPKPAVLRRYEELSASRDAWRQLLGSEVSTLCCSFFDKPLSGFKRKKLGEKSFTPGFKPADAK